MTSSRGPYPQTASSLEDGVASLNLSQFASLDHLLDHLRASATYRPFSLLRILTALGTNPTASPELLTQAGDRALNVPSPKTVQRLLANPLVPTDTVRCWYLAAPAELTQQAAEHPQCPHDLLAAWVAEAVASTRPGQWDRWVLDRVASNAGCPSDLLVELSASPSTPTRLALAGNPATPAAVLAVLAADEEYDHKVSLVASAHRSGGDRALALVRSGNESAQSTIAAHHCVDPAAWAAVVEAAQMAPLVRLLTNRFVPQELRVAAAGRLANPDRLPPRQPWDPSVQVRQQAVSILVAELTALYGEDLAGALVVAGGADAGVDVVTGVLVPQVLALDARAAAALRLMWDHDRVVDVTQALAASVEASSTVRSRRPSRTGPGWSR